MPKIKRIELPEGRTVYRQLHDAAVDLLPQEIAKDSLVEWVTEHDGLIREQEWSFGSLEKEWYKERGQALIFYYLGNSVLQTRIPFYFATIFHIGRMRQVSEKVLETISSARQSRVLQTWASSLSERLTGPAKEELAEATLKKLLAASQQYYDRQLVLANQWYSRWRIEVEPLRRNVEAMKEAWGQHDYRDVRGDVPQAFLRLWMTASSPSQLQISMLSEGVHFKSVPTPTPMGRSEVLGVQSWVVPLLLAGMADRSLHPDILVHNLLYLWDVWIQVERERLIEPQVQIAIGRLRTKYGDDNPFDEFAVGRHPATLSLRELVKENLLPNERPSPWLHTWKQTLEEIPWSDEPLPKPTAQEDSLSSALRQADSAIKDNITDEMRPSEAWNDFVQRIFEDEWVEKLGSMAGAANKKAGKTAVVWSLDDLIGFIDGVVVRLNGIGYALHTPARTRLERLLDKTSRGESVYGNDAW